MSKNVVIVSGGMIDRAFATQFIEKQMPDEIIGVDRGLVFLYENHISPTYIVGDFDSADKQVVEYYRNETTIPIRQFNPVKDASDTEIALRHAIELGATQIWILGGTGTRLDHVMANIQILKIAHDVFVPACLVDAHNRIRLIQKEFRLKKEDAFGTYFSVFPLGGIVEGFSIAGAKYPLSDHTLCPYDSLCVSNQFAEEEVAITFPEGIVIFMETCD